MLDTRKCDVCHNIGIFGKWYQLKTIMDQPGQNNCVSCRVKSLAVETLNSQELSVLQTNCAGARYRKGELIFRQGNLSSQITYVKTGLVKIHKQGPSREQILMLVKSPRFIGIPTILGNKIYQYSASAVESVEICCIDTDIFKTMILRNGKFANEIINGLCKDELRFFERSINQMQKQLHGRIADALLYFSEEIFESDDFIMPLSRAELGDFVHASRESVTRVLSALQRNGCIDIKGKKIHVLNHYLLQTISQKG